MRSVTTLLLISSLTLGVLFGSFEVRAQSPLDTTFVYQGSLSDGSAPVDYPVDFIARLFDAETGGTELGEVSIGAVSVSDGQFSLELDYGLVFNDENRWLELSVRESGSADPFTTLSPRQQIRATPFALFALNGTPGPAGPTGPAGPGVPPGGESGQIVYKSGSADYATTWGDAPVGLPIGGTTGQVLAKVTDNDFSTDWVDAPSGGALLAAAIGLPGSASGSSSYRTVSSVNIDMPEAGKIAASTTFFGELATYGEPGNTSQRAAVEARLLIDGVVVATGSSEPLSLIPAAGSLVGAANVNSGPVTVTVQVRYRLVNDYIPYLSGGVLRSFGIMVIGQ